MKVQQQGNRAVTPVPCVALRGGMGGGERRIEQYAMCNTYLLSCQMFSADRG